MEPTKDQLKSLRTTLEGTLSPQEDAPKDAEKDEEGEKCSPIITNPAFNHWRIPL